MFLLDMGEPVRISLAEQMVRLSGLSARCSPSRWGHRHRLHRCALEKLYEELLIDAESQPTTHPLIYRAEQGRYLPIAIASTMPADGDCGAGWGGGAEASGGAGAGAG